MTRSTALQRRARRIIVLSLAPLLPGVLLLGLTERSAHPLLAWSEGYAPWMLLVGMLLYAIAIIVLPYCWLRCAACRYRLTRSLSLVSLASSMHGVRHCPHCGEGLHPVA